MGRALQVPLPNLAMRHPEGLIVSVTNLRPKRIPRQMLSRHHLGEARQAVADRARAIEASEIVFVQANPDPRCRLMLIEVQDAVAHPHMQQGGRDAKPLRGGPGRHQAIRTLDSSSPLQRTRRGNAMLLAHRMNPGIGPSLASPRAESFVVQPHRDLMVRVFLCQNAQTREHLGLGASMPPQWRTAHLVPACRSPAPNNDDLRTAVLESNG